MRSKILWILIILLQAFNLSAQTEQELQAEIAKLEADILTVRDGIAEGEAIQLRTIAVLQERLDLLKSYADFKRNKSKYKAALVSLDKRADSLQTAIGTMDKKYSDIRRALEKKVTADRDKGARDVFEPLVSAYTSSSFDELVAATTVESVMLDQQLIGDDERVSSLLSNLLKFHKAESVLTRKCSDADVQAALDDLGSMAETEAVAALANRLRHYSEISGNLVEALSVCDYYLNGKNILVESFDRYERPQMYTHKYLSIMNILFKSIFSGGFDFGDYPYLSDVILDVIKLKKNHPDADLSEYIAKVR